MYGTQTIQETARRFAGSGIAPNDLSCTCGHNHSRRRKTSAAGDVYWLMEQTCGKCPCRHFESAV